jgi:UDPglucose 6-dehydrogenase
MHVSMIGCGFVGLVAGACMADFGMFVTCADIDQRRIAQLQAGKVPIYEPGLNDIIQRNVAGKRLFFTSDLNKAVRESLVIFVAVGTEARADGRPNLDHVRSVAQEVGRHMEDYKIIVLKSTVPVGTADKVAAWIRGAQPRPVDFDVVSNPEFLREGGAVDDFMHPNRVVLGAASARALAVVKDIYRPLYIIDTPFVITDNRTAELVKYATNSFLAMKISYANEIARLCERTGSDVHVVAKALGMDGRIGRKFLHPSPGWGGSCLPKDTLAFLRIFEDFGLKNHLVAAAVEVNREQPKVMLDKLQAAVGKLRGATVALLGLAYKNNTNDVRESPALALADQLLKAGAIVRAFDPAAMETTRQVFTHPKLQFAADAYEAVAGADAVVVATEWNEFRNLDLPRMAASAKGRVLLDTRNIYEPDAAAAAGFTYLGNGRVAPSQAKARPLQKSRRARAAGR